MRKLIFIFFLFISFVSKAQVYQEMPQYGYRANRMAFDSTLQIPTTCGVPTLKSVVSVNKKSAIAYDSCNNKFYTYNPKTQVWSQVTGGTSLDTTSLSNRINAKADSSIGLQKVLDNNNVAYNSIDLYDTINNKNLEIYITPNVGGNNALIGMKDTLDNYLVMQTNGSYNTPSIYFTNKGKQQYLNQQDSTSGNLFLPYQNQGEIDTLATLKNIKNSIPNLQQVTDVNDTTTNNIYLKHDTIGWHNAIILFAKTDSGVRPKIEIASANGFTRITPDFSYINDASNNQLQLSGGGLNFNNPTNYSVINPIQNGYHFYRLYQADTSKHNDTIALLKDIRSSTTTIDTANKWVNSVIKKDDSTLYIIKGTTTDSLTITGASYATKLKTKVWNNSGASIPRGAVVYINGAHSSNLPTIALAKANDEATSAYTYGLVEDTIANNSSGIVIQNGVITNLNLPTSTYTDGQVLYLSPTVAGGYTLTKPLAPNHYVAIGTITRAHPNFGTIQVAIRNGFQLDELSDVKIALVPADSTLLQFSRVDSLWHDVSVTNAIGTKYLKPTDTTSLSSRINLKVNISDTGTMLTPYLRKIDTASLSSRINLKVNISDTSTMLTKYLRKTDTATLSARIDAKGYALNLGATATNMNASATYYFGVPVTTVINSGGIRRVYIPKSGTITGGQLYVKCTGTGGVTSAESWTLSIRLNNSSNTTFASVANTSTDKIFSTTGLSISVVAGDYIEITTTTPAWTTAAGSTFIYGSIFIQ